MLRSLVGSEMCIRDRYRVMSADTAGRISAVLADAPSLAGRAPSALAQNAPRIAFKTGTSYGYRDAWSAGHSGDYTVVAWVGRADGAPRTGETGRKAAAPLLFDVFDMLARNGARLSFEGEQTQRDDGVTIARPVIEHTLKPEIVFPQNDVELFYNPNEGRGFSLSAGKGNGALVWYEDGDPIKACLLYTSPSPRDS